MSRTRKSEKQEIPVKSVLAALVLGILVMVASGVAHRMAFAFLNGQVTAKPLPAGTLAKLPMQIGDWQGVDVPLNAAIVKATDADDYVNRDYRRPGQRVRFYLTYGVRARDLEPHRPEICYPDNGWITERQQVVMLPADQADGEPLRCRIFEFSKGGLEGGTAVVVNYYLVDGESCPDESLLRSKAWRGSGAIDYMAQIQVVASVPDGVSAAKARQAAKRFAAASLGAVRDVLSVAVQTESE